jgi:hypothetical protein
MIKTLVVLFCISTVLLSFSKNIKAKLNKQYLFTVEKINVVHRNGEEYWTLKAVFKNNTKDTLKYQSMSCSYADFYNVSNNTFKIVKQNCLRNVAVIVTIPPYKTSEVELILIKNKNNKTNFNQFQIILHLVKVKNSKRRIKTNENKSSKNKNRIYSNAIEIFKTTKQ